MKSLDNIFLENSDEFDFEQIIILNNLKTKSCYIIKNFIENIKNLEDENLKELYIKYKLIISSESN